MKKIMIVAVSALTLGTAGCTTAERNTATGAGVGALGGAAIGAGITGDAEGALAGAAIGAVAGGVAGNLLGRSANNDDCVYADSAGRRYVAPCPAGY